MEQYIEALNEYMKQQGAESVTDMLFRCFCLENEVCLPAVSVAFKTLETVLEKLSLEDNDKLFLLTCQISEEYRREAFYTGLSVGVCLAKELPL